MDCEKVLQEEWGVFGMHCEGWISFNRICREERAVRMAESNRLTFRMGIQLTLEVRGANSCLAKNPYIVFDPQNLTTNSLVFTEYRKLAINTFCMLYILYS